MKNPPGVKKEEVFRANWSGFIPKDDKPISALRNANFAQMRDCHKKDDSIPTWREFVAEVLEHLVNNATNEELTDLLVNANYMDLKAFVATSKAIGVSNELIQDRFLKLKLGKK